MPPKSLSEEDTPFTMSPHQVGVFNCTKSNKSPPEKRVLSQNCLLTFFVGKKCLECCRKKHNNSKTRENYWREKYNDFLEFEGDHNDLSCLFKGIQTVHVPKEMQCLWDQQSQLLATKNKKQYRWHPK